MIVMISPVEGSVGIRERCSAHGGPPTRSAIASFVCFRLLILSQQETGEKQVKATNKKVATSQKWRNARPEAAPAALQLSLQGRDAKLSPKSTATRTSREPSEPEPGFNLRPERSANNGVNEMKPQSPASPNRQHLPLGREILAHHGR